MALDHHWRDLLRYRIALAVRIAAELHGERAVQREHVIWRNAAGCPRLGWTICHARGSGSAYHFRRQIAVGIQSKWCIAR